MTKINPAIKEANFHANQRVSEIRNRRDKVTFTREVKQYLVFGGDHYYPAGGWEDFLGFSSSLEAANELAYSKRVDWFHIVCEGEIIAEFSKDVPF
jgi:hypothetical protein